MGLSYFGRNSDSRRSECGCNYCEPPAEKQADKKVDPNPNPSKWEVLDRLQIGRYLVLKLRYPNCTTYEGRKVLVFKATWAQLAGQKMIDPHFGQGDLIYPIARFQPTADGWLDALEFAARKDFRDSE